MKRQHNGVINRSRIPPLYASYIESDPCDTRYKPILYILFYIFNLNITSKAQMFKNISIKVIPVNNEQKLHL